MTLKLASVALLIIAIQLSLAIGGFGGIERWISHPALVGLLFSSIGMGISFAFSGWNINSGAVEDNSNRWTLVVFGIIAVLSAYVPAAADHAGIWVIGGETIRWFGLLLFIVGGLLRVWPMFVLGLRFSANVAIQAEHRLETRGIYGFSRNPSFAGLLVNLIGWDLCFRSGIGLCLAASCLFPVMSRIRAEEKLMRQYFQGEYEDYCKRSWRLVPFVY